MLKGDPDKGCFANESDAWSECEEEEGDVMCGDAQASPKRDPCDPELAGAGESVEEASVPHAAAPADEDKLKPSVWDLYERSRREPWRYQIMSPAMAAHICLYGVGTSADESDASEGESEQDESDASEGESECEEEEGDMKVPTHDDGPTRAGRAEDDRHLLDVMSRINELFRVAGSDAQQRLWNSYVNDADQVSLLTLISRGL